MTFERGERGRRCQTVLLHKLLSHWDSNTGTTVSGVHREPWQKEEISSEENAFLVSGVRGQTGGHWVVDGSEGVGSVLMGKRGNSVGWFLVSILSQQQMSHAQGLQKCLHRYKKCRMKNSDGRRAATS